MADPVVTLAAVYPVAPMALARRAVLTGSRGPWTLPRGWSAARPDGDVRDRIVRRTADTPPNRLAVGLARLVIREIAAIRRDGMRDGHWDGTSLGCLAASLRREAEAVVQCPAFAEVPLDARVPLDSPSLQTNSRCRPLLDAWARIHRGLSLASDLPLDDVMIEPVARAEVLYERWCFAALCQAARKVTKLPGEGRLRRVYGSGERKVEVLYWSKTACGPTSGEDWGQDVPDWTQAVMSWSPVLTPDGFIIIGGKTAHVWDAKYRALRKSNFDGDSDDYARASYESGYLYQAHAFRDALRLSRTLVKESSSDPAEICWSLVLHPGLPSDSIKLHLYPKDHAGRPAKAVETYPATATDGGGVGIIAASPAIRPLRGAAPGNETSKAASADLVPLFEFLLRHAASKAVRETNR